MTINPLSNDGLLNAKQWALFIPLAVHFFSLATSDSLFTPLFQNQLSKREFDPALGGFVNGFNELTFLVLFPMSVYTVRSLGSRLMLHYGVFIVGLTFIFMGFAENYTASVDFLCLSFLLRIFSGVGASFAYMASFALIMTAFPGKAALAYFALFVAYGGGTIAGPVIGAITEDAGGFVLAYIFAGFALICVSYVVPCCLPPDESSLTSALDEPLTDIFPLVWLKGLKDLAIQVNSIIILSTGLAQSFLHETLEAPLKQFALSPVESSLTFSSLHGCALVAAVVVGLLCHRGAPPALFTITGLVSMMTGLFFIGPADFTDLLLDWEKFIMGILSFGIGFAIVLVSAFASLVTTVEGGMFSNIDFGQIAAIFTISFGLGSFLGSSLSGLFVTLFGFSNSTILFMVPLAFSLIAVVLHVCCGQPVTLLRNAKSNTYTVSYGTIDSTRSPPDGKKEIFNP